MKFKLVEDWDRLEEAGASIFKGASKHSLLQTLASWKILDLLYTSKKLPLNIAAFSNSGGQGIMLDGKVGHHKKGTWKSEEKIESSPQKHAAIHAKIFNKFIKPYFESVPEIKCALDYYLDNVKRNPKTKRDQIFNQKLMQKFFVDCHPYFYKNDAIKAKIEDLYEKGLAEFIHDETQITGQLSFDFD